MSACKIKMQHSFLCYRLKYYFRINTNKMLPKSKNDNFVYYDNRFSCTYLSSENCSKSK